MIEIHDEIPSTQTLLKEKVRNGSVSHLDAVLAHLQSEGRGRQGRAWQSDRGNLFLSIWIRELQIPLTWVPHWVGLSVLEMLVHFGVPSHRVRLKWPNDVMIDRDKKVAGVLCESLNGGVIAGVGVNLVSSPKLQDRMATHLTEVAPQMETEALNLKFAEALICRLQIKAQLRELEEGYQQFSLMRSGDTIEWIDIHTQAKGAGEFIRYGTYGELVAKVGQVERSLYSEEIKLRSTE